jgi:S-disulfanyl-L-cysteine oxidoreductase SoxD
MNRTILAIGAAVIVAVSGTAIVAGLSDGNGGAMPFIDPSNKTLVSRGQEVYVTYCAVCHGANLEGQPEWRTRLPSGRLPAPPHDESGHTWHHPDAQLVDIVKNGLVPGRTAPPNYQSDMPAYREILQDTDIVAVLAYIKSSWPREAFLVQKRMTMQQGD